MLRATFTALVLASLVSMLCVPGALATGMPASVSACGTIAQGGTYALASDLVGAPGADCVVIAAPGVSLALDGHTIRGAADGTSARGVFVAPGATSATVAQGSVTGFNVGIEADADGAAVVRVAATGNRLFGVEVRDSAGVKVSSSDASGNGAVGIYTQHTSRLGLAGDTADRNRADGIYLNDATDCDLAGNTASATVFNAGIYVAAATGCRLAGNTADDNQVGIILVGQFGPVARNTLTGNTVRRNPSGGLLLQTGATQNMLIGNNGAGNGANGSFDLSDTNFNCDSNTWLGNSGTRDQGCIR